MEGLPNALLEAMATGLPCIASNIGGNKDLIKHNVNGLLFDSGDVKGLAASIIRLLRNKEDSERFGSKAPRHTRKTGARCYLSWLPLLPRRL